MQELRINKFFSEMGICSRREADRLIESGKVVVDGIKATKGMKLTDGMQVYVDGHRIGELSNIDEIKPVLIAVNKPAGVVCTTTDNDRAENIVDMVGHSEKIYPIGRLDKDSRGLILMTNRGDLVNRILRSEHFHEKEYIVKVGKPLTADAITKMRKGIYLTELGMMTKPCKVVAESMDTMRITLTQGLNRQIRRMCQECGYRVLDLQRVRIMNIKLGYLKERTWRNITREELTELEEELR